MDIDVVVLTPVRGSPLLLSPFQLLVSGAAWSSARPSLEPGVSATPLGSLALKGVKEPLELWALRAAGEQQPVQQQQQVQAQVQQQVQAQAQAQQQQ